MTPDNAMTRDQIMQAIRTAIVQSMAETIVPVDAIRSEHTLSEIGMDSIAAVETAAHLERALNMRFPDDQLARVDSVADLMALVEQQNRLAA